MKKLLLFIVLLAAFGTILTGSFLAIASGNHSQLYLAALESSDAQNPDTVMENIDIEPTAPPIENLSPATTINPTLASRQSTIVNSAVVTPEPTEPVVNLTSISEAINTDNAQAQSQLQFKVLLNELSLKEFLALNDSFWSIFPLSIGMWCLFFIIAILLYLFRLKHLRRPLLFLSIIFFGFYLGGAPDPIHAIFNVFAQNQLLLNLILILLPVAVSLFWGRFYCGWLCPLGGVQEFLNTEHETRVIPQPLDRVLKYIKYIILIALGYLSWHTGNSTWQNYDLTRTFFTFGGPLMTLVILGGFLLVSLFISRPFCKYFCPLGAILGITSKLAMFRMRSDAKKCMLCGKCLSGECSMDAISAFNPEIDLPAIDNSECIKCFSCQKHCRNSALRVTGFRIDHADFGKELNENNNSFPG